MKIKALCVLWLILISTFQGYTQSVATCHSDSTITSCFSANGQGHILHAQADSFFTNVFDTSLWPPRWQCGTWSDFHGWLYILSDMGIWLAYFAIPLILGVYLYKKKNAALPFPGILILFIAFILSCGLTHLIDAVIFWAPVYKLSAVIRFITAVVSIGTVFALIKVAPRAMQFKSPEELEVDILDRTQALEKVNRELALEIQQKEAARQEGKLLLESLPLIAWVADVEGEPAYVNGRWKEYTGLDSMDESNRRKAIHPDDLEEGKRLWDNSVKTGEDFIAEQRLASSNGNYEWFLVKAVAIKNDSGEIVRWIGTNTNIDDQKRSEIRKDMFLNIASHELKTPLTSIKGYIELLKEIMADHKFEPVPTYLDKAYRSTQKLNNLIAELLDVSRIQSGKMELYKKPFDVDEMIQDVIEIFQHDNVTHRIIFNGNVQKAVVADRSRIEQVVNNLLSNAIKYSPKAYEVVVTTRESDGNLMIEVQDFGVGIKKDECNKLFDQFYRSPHVASSANGLGMGLYISKEIARQHGGTIRVESSEGEGSKFTLTIPVMS